MSAPVNVSEADVTAAYEKAKDKIGKRPALVAFRQIIVAPKANPAARLASAAVTVPSIRPETRRSINCRKAS